MTMDREGRLMHVYVDEAKLVHWARNVRILCSLRCRLVLGSLAGFALGLYACIADSRVGVCLCCTGLEGRRAGYAASPLHSHIALSLKSV
jgi:hypothetical protein